MHVRAVGVAWKLAAEKPCCYSENSLPRMAACDFKDDESEARMAKKKSLDDAFAATVANALSGVIGEATPSGTQLGSWCSQLSRELSNSSVSE